MVSNKCVNKFVIPFVFLFFQQAIIEYFPFGQGIISYFDEIYILLFFCLLLVLNRFLIPYDSEDACILIGWLIFILTGLISSVLYEIQPITISLLDLFVCSKFVLCYYSIRLLRKVNWCEQGIVNKLAKFAKLYAVFVFFFAVINEFIPIFPVEFERNSIKSIQLFFPHPTFLAISCIVAACLIITRMSRKNRKYDMLCIYLLLFVTVMTLRTKAVVGALIILFVYLYFIKLKIRNIYLAGVLVLVLVYFFAYDQIVYYYGSQTLADTNFVRSLLTRKSVELANEYFPLGTGFATFGSNTAVEHFSPLYEGLGLKSNRFLSDTFWPIVIAQTGWIGTFGFLLILFGFIKKCIKLYKLNVYLFWAATSLIGYELICTLGESAFFHPSAMTVFFLLGLIMNVSEKNTENKELFS